MLLGYCLNSRSLFNQNYVYLQQMVELKPLEMSYFVSYFVITGI